MELLNRTINYVKIFGVASVAISLLLLGLGIYFLKIKKTKMKELDVDYNSFNRKDSLEYVRLDDIRGVIIDKEHNRFVSGIKCTGFDYGDAESSEQLQAMRGYLSFLNLLDQRSIQFWQTARNVDLDELIDQYKEELEELQEKRFLLNLDYESVREESEKYLDREAEYGMYYERLRKMQRELTSRGYQCEQLQAQICYMEAISGEEADPQQETCYIFDWTYNKMEFTVELDEGDVLAMARKQLLNTANSYMAALRSAGVKCTMLTDAELLACLRRHMHPVSADIYKIDDVLKSAYDSLAVTSKSYEEKEETVNAATIEDVLRELEGRDL